MFLINTTRKHLLRIPCMFICESLQHYVLYPLQEEQGKEKLEKERMGHRNSGQCTGQGENGFEILIIGHQINK